MATRKSKKAILKTKPATKLRALSGGRQSPPATSSKAKSNSRGGSKVVDTDAGHHEVVANAEETTSIEATTGGDNLPLAVLGDVVDVEEQSLEHASLGDMFKLVSAAPGSTINETNQRQSDLDQDDIDEPTLRPPEQHDVNIDEPTLRPPELHDVNSSIEDMVETEDDGDQSPIVAVEGDLLEGLGDIPDTAALLRHAIEAMLFVSDKPITLKDLSKGLQLDKKRTMELLSELRVEYENRGIRIDEIADGYAFRTHPSVADYVRNFLEQRPVKLSRAQLETLSIVAYRQPITRPEVDDIRGVDCGPVLKGLLERDLVRILGKKDEPGRPMLYGTTPSFLELFGLKSLQELPTLREFAELNEDSKRKYEEEIGEGPPLGLSDLGLVPDDTDASEAVGLGAQRIQDPSLPTGSASSGQGGGTLEPEATPFGAVESSPSRGKEEDEEENDEEGDDDDDDEDDDEEDDDEEDDDEEDDDEEDDDEEDDDEDEVEGEDVEDEDDEEDEDEDEDDEEDDDDDEDENDKK